MILKRALKLFLMLWHKGNTRFTPTLITASLILKSAGSHELSNDFDLILERAALHERALFYRGVAKLNLEENEEAIHDLDRFLALNPDRGAAYLARGLAHYALGHREEVGKNIHDNHALNHVELGEFMEEYILSNSLFRRALKLFERDNGKWRLSLTEDEIQRMAILH